MKEKRNVCLSGCFLLLNETSSVCCVNLCMQSLTEYICLQLRCNRCCADNRLMEDQAELDQRSKLTTRITRSGSTSSTGISQRGRIVGRRVKVSKLRKLVVA